MKGHKRFSGRRIVVVEDSRTQAEYLCHILEKEGCIVVMAADGSEALGAIHRERPDIVLTDIVMPGIDGYELCRKIKEDPKTKDIPVILVTQLHDPSDVLKGLEAGAENFIVKPYDPEQVYSRIHATLDTITKPDPDGRLPDIEYVFDSELHTITSGRYRILDILLSTYEFAVKKNAELQEAQERMSALNEELMATVEELQLANRNLSRENTERGRVERALGDANRKLNLMTSVTRHDINNQILALHGFIDLSEGEIRDEKVLQYIRKAKTAVHAIQKQIAFTKQYEDIGVKAPQWQDLSGIVDSLQPSLAGASIEPVARDLSYEIYADPLLPKVFENLIDNSIRHGKQVTRITISASRAGSGSLVLEFQDNGVGVAEGEKAMIFQKGFGKNTGLGLFISREILEITGISIREIGIPGRGVLFEIIIPPEGVRKAGTQ